MKDPAPQKTNTSPEQQPHSLEGASFSRTNRRLDPPSPPALTNKQITLDYRVHRDIFRAIIANDAAALRSCRIQHKDIRIRAEDALSMCISLSRFDLIPVILDIGGKPEELRSAHLETLMILQRFDLVKLLVEAGAPVNNIAGESEALGRAERHFFRHLEVRFDAEGRGKRAETFDFSQIEFLLKHGARMDATMPEVRRRPKSPTTTPGHWLDSHYQDFFSLFEKYGVQLRTDRNFGDFAEAIKVEHPIERAIARNDLAKVSELVNADPGALSMVENPLSKAVLNNCSSKMLQFLVDHNCDVNEDHGKPLLYACPARGFIDPFHTPYIVRCLLRNGADPTRRGSEAFLNACERFPDTLGSIFFETNALPQAPQHCDTALRELLNTSLLAPEFEFSGLQERRNPGFKLLSMVKKLVDRGADPYSATLHFLREASLAPFNTKLPCGINTPTSHYKGWGEFLRERLAELPSTGSSDPYTAVKSVDECYQNARDSLHHSEHSLMQLGNDSTQRAPLSSLSRRYCHLMAQVLEPSSSCWINSLITNRQRHIPAFAIHPYLLKDDHRYKMLSDVAAIATVLYSPFVLREKFIDLAKATFSDTVKLKDSQERNESVLEWLPTTQRLIKHFVDSALLPALFSRFRTDALFFLTRGIFAKVKSDLSLVAAEALLEGRSLREIRDFTKRWHALSDKHPIPISLYDSWNRILPDPIPLSNGFLVKDIHTVESLREIGRKMNNCLVDGVHASQCYLGRSRILAIFKDDIPIVAMTLEKLDGAWQLTEYEGPNYTKPDEGPDSPLTQFKKKLAEHDIQFNHVYEQSILEPQEYDNLTSDGMFSKYANYLDNNRSDLAVPTNHTYRLALQAPGINGAAFYRRWVVLSHKDIDTPVPLLRDEAIGKCNESLNEVADALSLYLEYSQKLYMNYPEWAVKKR